MRDWMDMPKETDVYKRQVYGATQGIFALESTVNELAEKLHMDPVELRMKNIVREGMFMPAYFGETANALSLIHI